jgi:hypothetical protein
VFDDDTSIKRLPKKVDTLEELTRLARQMCDKFDVPAQRTFKLTYVDSGDDKITIMEQDDLDVAYAIAIGGSMKLKFNIELVSDKVF